MFLTTKIFLTSDATQGAETIWNASQVKIVGGNIHHLSACEEP